MKLNVLILSSAALVAVPLSAQTNTFPASGNVGIGTTSPDRALQVNGSIAARSTTSGNGYVVLDPGSSTFAGYIEWYKAGGSRLGYLGYLDLAGGQGNLGLNLENSANFVVGGGNVGIGTASPNMALHVKGGNVIARFESTAASSLVYFSPSGWDEYRIGAGVVNVNDWGVQNMSRSTTPFVITGGTGGGNVGIGVSSPYSRFHVSQSIAEVLAMSISSSALAKFSNTNNTTGNFSLLKFSGPDNDTSVLLGSALISASNGDSAFVLGVRDGGGTLTEKFRVTSGGNVGIGTTNPTQKLSVNGTIQAKEVVVQTGWSDYVFKPDYKLASLSEVEAHIKAHGYLPGLPSELQVAKEGVSVGEMQSKLLAKIEELTLHQIEQEKEISALKAEVIQLRKNSAP